ncbi:DUF599 family protein [Alphaproteobacteria bacterium HT1-32]|nr:DUF599 family protein [Alphaproteobacteria bacterium HT1-32]
MPAGVTWLDAAALLWFFAVWIGYTRYVDADGDKSGRRNLQQVMHLHRVLWMEQMIARDNRMIDGRIIGNLTSGTTFMASTTIFLLAGVVALLGASDRAIEAFAEFEFAVRTTKAFFEGKLLILALCFVYAFFKFTWAMRQYNYCAVLIGAAPAPHDLGAHRQEDIEALAAVSSNAAKHSNRGLRAYYFGMAMLSWFIHPVLFIVITLAVVAVLYRREFSSRMVRILRTLEADLSDRAAARDDNSQG